jgi:hypothetical protein
VEGGVGRVQLVVVPLSWGVGHWGVAMLFVLWAGCCVGAVWVWGASGTCPALTGPCWCCDHCQWWVLVWAFCGWKQCGWLGNVQCPRTGGGGCHGLLWVVVFLLLGCGPGWPLLLWVELCQVTWCVWGHWGRWAMSCVLGQVAAAVVGCYL